MIPVITLGAVFLLIAVRQVGKIRFRIWQIMLLGAFTVLVTGQISPGQAVGSIDIDVMLFLFGVFVIGRALEESGYPAATAHRFFSKAGTTDILVLMIVFSTGLLSAFLMNDTIAVIGTPVVLLLARHTGIQPKILLLALAFSITTGSVMSPIGNPQNLLIAMHGDIDNPFITFFRYLCIPTMINLLAVFFMIRLFYRGSFNAGKISFSPEPLSDPKLTGLVKISLSLLVIMVLVKITFTFTGLNVDFRLTWISLVSALPVILFSSRRVNIVRGIDWSTLVFFAAMFILMASVWDSGFFQDTMASMNLDMTSKGTVMAISILLSQLISNVPLVALYLPVVMDAGGSTAALMALAAGSTIAGNLTILGAASNVIIIQNAEKSGAATLTFWEFIRIGIPLTIVNSVIYWLFLLI